MRAKTKKDGYSLWNNFIYLLISSCRFCDDILFFLNCHRFLVAGGQTVDPAEAAADLIDSGQAENLPYIGG